MKISIVIATYNSMKTLPMVITSIKKQTINPKEYEIICVDGSSTDGTLDFIHKENLKLVNNLKKEPVHAKYLGFLNAKGKYLMYLDHDEELTNKKSLELKIDIFETNPNVKCIAPTGYLNPKGYHFINNYINEFGDPFSYFIYGISKNKDFYLSSMSKKYSVAKKDRNYLIFNINKQVTLPLIELLAGGSLFDLEFVKKNFPNTLKDETVLTHLFYLITNKNPYFAITRNDSINHYSSDTFLGYLKKIEWRIKNNIYFKDKLGKSGFTGREDFNSRNKYKKFLFIPYSFSLILPIIDSIYLVLTRRNFSLAIHFPLTLYTSFLILFHLLMYSFGVKSPLTTYDGKTKILEK